jgi:hypothetical protein
MPGAVPAFTVAGTSTGITNMLADSMATEAMTFFKSQYGQEGAYLKEYLLGMYDGFVAELLQTTNISISGFGGEPGRIAGLDVELMAEDMKTFLPSPANSTEGSKRILRALSHGVVTVMQRDGKVAVIPNAPIPPTPPIGPCIAKLT